MHTETNEPKPLMEMWPHSRTERLRVQLWPLSANVDVYDFEEHEWRRVATAHRNAESGPYDLSMVHATARDLVSDAMTLYRLHEEREARRAAGIQEGEVPEPVFDAPPPMVGRPRRARRVAR